MDLKSEIKRRLRSHFTDCICELSDLSHQHKGHPGNVDNKAHFVVNLATDSFKDLKRIARHQSVMALFSDLFETHLHALQLNLYSHFEWDNKHGKI